MSVTFFCRLLDGLPNKLSVQHRAQSKGMMNGALLLLHRHPLIVTELREHDTDEQRVTVRA